MESSGNGRSAGDHRNRADGAIDFSEAVGCIRAGHGPDCPERHEFLTRLKLRVELARKFLLLPADIAPCDRCVVAAYEWISEEIRTTDLADAAVTVDYVTEVANRVVSDHYVEQLRANRSAAWRAFSLRLLQLACKHMGHRYGAPSATSDMDDGSAGVLYAVNDDDAECERIWTVVGKVLPRLMRKVKAGEEILNIGGLMDTSIQNQATSIKKRLTLKATVAGLANPERPLLISALGGRDADGEDGPAFEIAALDERLEQVLEEPENEARARFIERLTAFFEAEKTNRKRLTTPRQRAEMILQALSNPDVSYTEIAEQCGVTRHYVDVQVNRFSDLLKDSAARDRLGRLFGADSARWPLPPAGGAQPLTADTLTPPPDADTADTGNLADPADATSAQHAPTTLHGRPVPPDAQQPAGGRDSLRQDVSQDDSLASLRGAEDADG